jgi:hypothetical protein
MYVCFLLNNTWCEVVDDIPIRMSTGSTNDISPLLCFHFWEPVYYKLDESDFPSDSREKHGHFVGISESVGLEPGDIAMPIVKSHHDSADDGEILPPMLVIDPSELIGHTFLMDKEDGQ